MLFRRIGGDRAGILAALIPVAFISGFFILPYAAAIGPSLAEGPMILIDRFKNGSLGRIVAFTVAQGAASALLSLFIGIPGAWLLGTSGSRSRGRGRFARAILAVPFAMPPVLVVLGFVLFFGNAGWANRAIQWGFNLKDPPLHILYKPWAIVLAHGFYNFPLVVRLVGDALTEARRKYAHSASTLGASPAKAFFFVYAPLAGPAIASATILSFLYSFTSFAIVLVLGGGPLATTMAVEIYRAAKVTLDFDSAGALATAETLIAILAYALYGLSESVARKHAGSGKEGGSEPGAVNVMVGGSTWLAKAYWVGAGIFVLGPIGAVFLESFLTRSRSSGSIAFTLRWWADALNAVMPATLASIALALLASTIAVVMAAMAAMATWAADSFWTGSGRNSGSATGMARRGAFLSTLLGTLCSIPIASSGIVLAFGWMRVYGVGGGRLSILAAAALQAAAALPFAYRSIKGGLNALSPYVGAAAQTLGARPSLAGLLVALPAVGPSIRSAFAFSIAISLGELNAVLMLGIQGFTTLPILIYRASGAYRFGVACAAGTVLAALCAIAFIASDNGGFRTRRPLTGNESTERNSQ